MSGHKTKEWGGEIKDTNSWKIKKGEQNFRWMKWPLFFWEDLQRDEWSSNEREWKLMKGKKTLKNQKLKYN